jgi:hypothetical protein
MVGIQPMGPFCDLGTPITDKEGNLLAIGASRQPGEGGFMTQFFEVGTIRATLEAWKH